MATAPPRPINVDLVRDLLEFDPCYVDGSDVDLADPPRNADGKLICGRQRADWMACTTTVGIPWVPCDAHEPDAPIADRDDVLRRQASA